MKQTELIWFNGEFVKWEDATVHVLTHGLHYGTGVFEGVRCYDTEIGPAVFRHTEHLERLKKSSDLYYMDIPYSLEELRSATKELIARNGLRSCYIRPLVFRGYGTMGLFPLDAPVDVAIAVWEWGAYLGDEGKRNGVRAKVSSWRRISPDSLIPQAKASGQYLNSILAKIEVHKAGYEEAILLDDHGHVNEARARTSSSCATASSSRRRRPPRSWTGSTASRRSRSPATWGSRSSSATSRGPSCTWPTRST